MNSSVRLNQILRELNITTTLAADALANKGHLIDPKPTTKITDQQVELLRNEFQKRKTQIKESFDFEIGKHYNFVIKENRDVFSIVYRSGQPFETYTSDRIYQNPNSEVKLFVKRLKDDGNPILIYSILNDYKLNEEYVFDAIPSPRGNGYLLENNEYHEHFVPLSFQPLIEDGTMRLKVAEFDEANNKIIFDDSALEEKQLFSSIGSSSLVNGQDYKFDVIGLKEDYNGEDNLIRLNLEGKEYITRALGFQKDYGLPKWIYCTVDKEDQFRLYQNFTKSYREAFEEQKPYFFTVIDDKIDHNEAPYYIVQDDIGFTHRFYKNQLPTKTLPELGAKIRLFISAINEKSGHLKLDWYEEDFGATRSFYSPKAVFDHLPEYSIDDHLYNLQGFIDEELERTTDEEYKPPFLDMFSQIEKENNNWFFSYLSLLSQYNNTLILQGQYDRALNFIQLYIHLEEWLIESDFISAYSKDKKQEIIDNAESIAETQRELIDLISDLRDNRHYDQLERTLIKLKRHGIISKGDLNKTMDYLKWDRTLLTTHYDLIYEIIHLLIDNNKLYSEDLWFLNQITSEAYEFSHAGRTFVLTSGIQTLNETEKLNLITENKHLLVQIRLHKTLDRDHYAVIKSAEILRNLALLADDEIIRHNLLLSSIDLVIKEKSLEKVTHTELENIETLALKIKGLLQSVDMQSPKLFFFKTSGTILMDGNSLMVSNQISNFKENLEIDEPFEVLLSLFEDRIKLVTSKRLAQNYLGLDTKSSSFWGTYVNHRKTLNAQFENLEPSISHLRHQSIRSVIKSIDYIISSENDINKKIEALQLAKLITVTLKDNKSYYYQELIRFYYRMGNLERNVDNDYLAQPINSETLESFPVLQKLSGIHSIVNYIGDTEASRITPYLNHEDSVLQSIAKMVVAYNNVLQEYPEQNSLVAELLSLVKSTILTKALFVTTDSENSPERVNSDTYYKTTDLVINEGREDNFTEFKTSIVFLPGLSAPDLEKQASQIIKVITGFLNAKGGRIYLGIKDNGMFAGLAPDYKQLDVNSDGYERLLRKFIVALTNSTVNGLLDFEFVKWASSEYLIIHIPSSEAPIDFKGDFYQRQGTETRLIKGQDLTNLIKSKLQPKIQLSNVRENESIIQTELKFTGEESEIYNENRVPIATQVETKDGLYRIGIYEDRSWIWSDNDKNFDFGAKLNFTISDKDSYILICYGEGRLAKFRSRSFLARNKNERQLNTFALRPDSEIVNIIEIKQDIPLLAQIAYAGDTYLKIIDSSVAGEVRNSLSSQGTYFVNSNNDGIISLEPIDLKTIESKQKDRLLMSKQTLGVVSTSDRIKDLVAELTFKKYL